MQSRWVMHEASRAIDRGVYAPVRIDLCVIDVPYSRLQATDIIKWDGKESHPGVLDLFQRVNELLPRRKSFLLRTAEWSWKNRSTIVADLFAVVALSIIAWQTAASRSQLSKMESIVGIQQSTAKELKKFREDSQESLTQSQEMLSASQQTLENAKTKLELTSNTLDETMSLLQIFCTRYSKVASSNVLFLDSHRC